MNDVNFSALSVAGLAAGLAAICVAMRAAVGARQIVRLTDVAPANEGDLPSVSLVVAARDEADHVSAALASWRAIDYPPLEIVVVDDRSTDGTGAAIAEASGGDARVRAVRVDDLPPGWLGKTHALATGAAGARGTLLLFTDADVHFRADALRRAVALVQARQLNHLAVLPAITSPSRAVRAMVAAFALFFLLFTRAWDVAHPRRRASIGIGAFTLVRASSYRRAGGHAAIRLRPDDDLQLGRLLKASGARCDVAVGHGLIAVDWYASVRELVRGLEKNSFAGANYNVFVAAAGVGLLCAHAALFMLPVFGEGAWRSGSALVCAALVAAGGAAARTVGLSSWYAVLQPAAALFFAWVQARATCLTLWRGGITWRGTFYPLKALREAAGPSGRGPSGGPSGS